jgi:chaperonin GroES
MKIKPIGDRVLIEREESEEKTSGGILLPDTAKEKPQIGKVVAVGDGRVLRDGKRVPLHLKVGDRVYFTSWAGDEFKDSKGGKLLLMREEDILCTLG